jgi:hypothetical protein
MLYEFGQKINMTENLAVIPFHVNHDTYKSCRVSKFTEFTPSVFVSKFL